jgi:hypothetical protein
LNFFSCLKTRFSCHVLHQEGSAKNQNHIILVQYYKFFAFTHCQQKI